MMSRLPGFINHDSMTIQSNGSFLSLTVSHRVFHMVAQIKLVNLLVCYAVMFLLFFLWRCLRRRFFK